MKKKLIQELVKNGYKRQDLLACNKDELALLLQETRIDNTWTDAARAKASASREAKSHSSQQPHVPELGEPGFKIAFQPMPKRIPLKGNTYPHRGRLGLMGAFFNRKTKQWEAAEKDHAGLQIWLDKENANIGKGQKKIDLGN